jgi:nitrate reductase gamma subunit
MASVRAALACLPYLTTLAFAAGLAWRIRRWSLAAAPPAPLFPLPDGTATAWGRIGVEICLLQGRRPGPSFSWLGPWCFHAALALILIGHLRAVTDFPRLWAALALSPATVDALAAVAGGAAGLLALASGCFLLGRRLLLPRLREISQGEDVFALVLLLAVILSGLAMRFGPPVDLGPVRAYFAALAAFAPGPMPDVPGFAVHFLLAQALAVYAPCGKLLHMAGVIPAKAGWYKRPPAAGGDNPPRTPLAGNSRESGQGSRA